jgi:hypothetical protein
LFVFNANQGNIGPPHKGLSCFERIKQLQKEQHERELFEEWKKDNEQADDRTRIDRTRTSKANDETVPEL